MFFKETLQLLTDSMRNHALVVSFLVHRQDVREVLFEKIVVFVTIELHLPNQDQKMKSRRKVESPSQLFLVLVVVVEVVVVGGGGRWWW